jgi:kynurenine formamidase
MLSYTYGAHSGTHIDAPSHILQNGKHLDNYPIEYFIGSCQTLDCRGMTMIEAEYINQLLNKLTTDYILLYTGADQQWGTPAYYLNYPVLSPEAASLLAELPIRGIGIDAPSFDPQEDSGYQNHRILLEKEILLIENLTCLNQTPDHAYTLFCFPLNFAQSEASPSRVCASINPVSKW